MGFIDFVTNAGQKLFEGPEESSPERATKLIDFVDRMGLAVEGLTIHLASGTATIGGVAPSQSVREKVVLAVGNTDGVAKVEDEMTVASSPEPTSTFYTVSHGDTLSKIAEKHFGDPMQYHRIFEANRPMLAHPDKIYPGQVLRLPPL